jgi:hypothetical protein
LYFPCANFCPRFGLLAIAWAATVSAAFAQTVRVDMTPSHSLRFDPDKAMGSSMDILPAKDFDAVYSRPILKEALSAGWGPITYRQNRNSRLQPGTGTRMASGATHKIRVANEKLEILQHTAQYYASQLLNLDWVKHGAGMHQLYPANVDLQDEAGHTLITAYAAKRPDGECSLLIINKDPSNAHEVAVQFSDGDKEGAQRFTGNVKLVTFGVSEYVWHPSGPASHAEPDGPAKTSQILWKEGQTVLLPKASVNVLTGKLTP